MRSGMIVERGDLLLIPFPFTDLSATKRRPVLALTQPDEHGDFTGLPVTSRPQHSRAIPLTPGDLASGSLPVASWIRFDRVVTLHSGLVIRSVARVSEPVIVEAVRRLCDHLGRG